MSVNQFPANVQLTPLPAFTDNYIWCMHSDTACVVVDPGDADVVIDFCKRQAITLSAILITHHHADHTGGLDKLVSCFKDLDIYGPVNAKIKQINQRVTEGIKLCIDTLALSFEVIEIPGHTLDHLGFVGHGGVFCGDTLFNAGCGRLFEGTPAQMLDSLGKLTALPDATKVWCTHEYTLANLSFANTVDTHNAKLREYTAWAKETRDRGQPTLPTDIGTQKAINPFLRANNVAIKQASETHANAVLGNELAVFTEVRRWKDIF